MASGFYGLLGIEPTSSAARVRSAYGQARGRLTRLRRERQAAGEPVDDLDLAREKLDEAWEVLSDPLRRRRYDALLSWSAGPRPTDPAGVWRAVGESLVHPAAAVAVRLLRVTSQLTELGDLPRAASGAAEDRATLVPHDDDLTTPRLSRPADPGVPLDTALPPAMLDPPSLGEIVPVRDPTRPRQARVAGVDRDPPSGVVLDDRVRSLIDELGYSGALLRAVREHHGLTLRAVSERTRIGEAYLAAVEEEAPGALPTTFVRGYVREIARVLRLDADAVVLGYMERYPG